MIWRRIMIEKGKNLIPGLSLSALVAVIAIALSSLLPGDIIGATVMALLVGMALNPFFMKHQQLYSGVTFSSKKILRLGIILMGVNLNFAEVWDVGKYALFLMTFTMLTALDRKSTRLNSSHVSISYAVFCLKKKKQLF